ncbi:MAG: insulinase family protein [Muribaculaceae bacterium]|nr:insulinase family protein [Muribaculaceae bacterium]
MKFKHLLVAALMLITAGTAMAQMPQMPPIPIDKEVRMGKLPNGLTYYVRHNEYPEHRVNFYIAQRVGSIQEEESQRGLAHFLEHMAFNGTVNYPGNGVIDYTRTLGVEFGRDLNAYTSVDQTVYNINDVPSTRVEALDSCLLILKDWSNGLLLEDEEIDKERGVIHEEWRLRSSASQRMFERNLETLYPGSKYGKRMPIGLMSVIDNFKYEEIRNYYHKWYRPDNQAIIVVGDVDVDRTEAKIKEMFGVIPAPAADAAQVVDEAVPDNDNMIVVVDKDKEMKYSIVQVMFKHEATTPEEKSSLMYLFQNYILNMTSSMLNARLAEKAQEPDCPFIQASADDGQYIFAKTCDAFTVSALPKPGMTEQATKAVITEVKRALQHGFTGTEFVRAREEYMSRLEKTYNERNKISNERYGRSYAAHYLGNEPIPSIEDEYMIMGQIAPNIPVEAINQTIPQLVSDTEKNVVVINFNQEVEGATYPETAALKNAVNEARNAEVTAYVDNVKDEPLITKMPKAGKIVKEKAGDKFGYTELTLSNGARVILKKTNYKENEIIMQAESKGGSSLYDKKDYANIAMFDYANLVSGLGQFDNTELDKALAGKQAQVSLSLSTSYERLSGKSTVKDLETMFQLAYLRMTDVRKDEKAYNSLMAQLETVLKNKDLEPEAVFADSVNNTLENHSWRELPFNVEDLKNVNYDRIMQMTKERTANAADFTFYFVGNFDETLIRQYICQYIASLPAKKGKTENYKNVAERPSKDVVNMFTRKMETPKANAQMFWYTFNNQPSSVENSVKVKMAAQVLDKIYLKKIREDAGAAYSAGARGGESTIGDMTYTYIKGSCPFKPEMKDLAIQIMRDEINTVATTIDEATLKDIKEVMLKDYETSCKENSYWLSIINMYVSKGKDVHSGYKAAIEAQTPASVSAFVKNVLLGQGTHVEVIMLPEE